MPQPIGSAGREATAWANNITSALSPQVKKARDSKVFTEKHRSLFETGESLDTVTRRRMEALFGHELEGVHIHHGYQAEEASRDLGARAFTIKSHIFGPRQNLDSTTVEGQRLLAHELTHVVQQTQPPQLPQSQAVHQKDDSTPAASPGDHSDAGMVYLSNSQSISRQQREAQAQATEQAVNQVSGDKAEQHSPLNPKEVADKVYRLMQRELILERERVTRLGG